LSYGCVMEGEKKQGFRVKCKRLFSPMIRSL